VVKADGIGDYLEWLVIMVVLFGLNTAKDIIVEFGWLLPWS
jgi:hypothetical protein